MNRQQRRAAAREAKRRAASGPGAAGASADVITPEVESLLGRATGFHNTARFEQAAAVYRQVLDIHPGQPDALHLLGILTHQTGDSGCGIAMVEEAARRRPADALIRANFGKMLYEAGQLEAAGREYERAFELNPENPEVGRNLAAILLKLGQHRGAIPVIEQVLARNPDDAEAHNNLAIALVRTGSPERAMAACERASALAPAMADPYVNLTIALRSLDRLNDAEQAARRAIELDPSLASAYMNLGFVESKLERNDLAKESFKRAMALDPELTQVHDALANVFASERRFDEAEVLYRKALSLHPRNPTAHSNLLFMLSQQCQLAPADLLSEHRRWQRQQAPLEEVTVRPHRNARTSDRVLRVGYISPDFRRHPVATFIEPVIEAHDRDRVEIFAYAEVYKRDGVTERIARKVDHWRMTAYQETERVDDMIRDDRIDVLVDLAGHTAHNRMDVMARKPAPVQATYLGYFTTTGLSTVDYWIADDNIVPPDTEERAVEEVYRLPRCWVSFEPPHDAPAVGPLPALSNGSVTFGSFNDLLKILPQTVELWARVLQAVPGSGLMVKTKRLFDPAVRADVHRQFAAHGIAEDRLLLRGQVKSLHEHLAMYNEVDIALDTVPRTGGTTTAEATWMGVPVLTLAGRYMIERQSAGMLLAAGLDELVTGDADAYVAKAVSLAGDPDRLASLRASLRGDMAASPLCDKAGLARALEDAYRDMWRRYLDEN